MADKVVDSTAAAGLLSFLSPCVLPLVPAYLSYLGGRAANDQRPARQQAQE